jgi:DNA-binding HxlR family transcriptional regulator
VTRGTRTYGDACGIARALDLIGERWALLIVRELILGPKRFTDLRSGLPNLSPNVLAQRLRELDGAGIVVRDKLPPPVGAQVYELTDWGRELESVLTALGRWGARSPVPAGVGMSVHAHMLALKSLFDPDAAGDLDAAYELRLAGDTFRARVARGEFELVRGAAERPDATIETDPDTLVELLWQGRALAEAVRSGDAAVEGDRAAMRRFLALFPRPEPAPMAALTSG